MIWLFAIFAICCLIGIKFSRKGFKDYLDKEQTNAIRGIFAMIIFFSHFRGYVDNLNMPGDDIFVQILLHIGQLMVAAFLFYSGYGVFVSAQKKGEKYIKNFAKNRILKTWLFFACAVLLYLVYALICGRQYSIGRILLSFVGWESIGNSSWFMFAILYMYIATYIAALLTKKEINLKTIGLITVLSLVYIAVIYKAKPGETWWCDTILCYIAGMAYGYFKKQLDHALEKKYIVMLLASVVLFVGINVVISRTHGIVFLLGYNLWACALCLLISAITYCVKIDNAILQFLGKYGFEIYILQRIPDMILQPYLSGYEIPYFLISFSLTLLMAISYQKVLGLMTTKVLKIGA